jgi:hypothetical protein
VTSPTPERGDALSASESPWTDYVSTIAKSWRFVVYGTVVVWAGILAAALLVPRGYVATAAVSLPDINEDGRPEDRKPMAPLALYERLDRGETWRRTGVSIAFYREMERVLSDEAVLRAGLKGQLDPSEIGRLVGRFEDHFTTLTTNPRNEIQRIERTDGITGVVVSYTTGPPAHARAVIEALIALVREAFVTTLARQEIRQQMLVSSRTAAQARQDHMNLTHANESLEKQAREMLRLLQEAPVSKGPEPQVMVNPEGRGHLYVSPASQLVGVKAGMAENAHLMRTFQREAAIEELRVTFLRRVDARLQGDAGLVGSRDQSGIPGVLRAELEAFLEGKTGEEVEYVRAQTLGLCDVLASAADAARMVQAPTLSPKPRAAVVVGGMIVVLSVFLCAAVVVESWKRGSADR